MSLPLFALFLAAFAFGTAEFVIAGVLPEVAGGLNVTIPVAGYLVSGYAVGIASALLSADGRMETSMGRILPIETARRFLDDMRTGRPAWDGLLESAFEPELLAARNAATQGDWETARALVETPGVLANPDAALKAAVFSMHEEGFTAEGRAALERVSAMAPHFPFAALLRHWDAWRRGVPPDERPCRQDLLQAAWWSPFEPYGQVARLLERPDGLEPLARGAETPMEWALYHWAAGTAAAKKGDRERAAELLQTGLRGCLDDDSHVRDLLAASLWFECGKRHRIAFDRDAPKRAMRFQDLDDASATLISGDWEKARKALERHFKTPRRESANTLGLGLMLGQAKGLAGDAEGERKSLQEFRREIRNPWYRTIADCLLGDADADATLATVAGKRPETLTLALALGLQAEGRGEIPRALDYYRAALDTGQINWLEYQIAQARRDALGKP